MTTGYEATFAPAMRLALAAAAAAGTDPAGPDVPVGAVILDAGGAVVARARNRREADGDPTAHAEMLAIRAAARYHGSVAADRLHARRDAGAVHHVRGRGHHGPHRTGWCTAPRIRRRERWARSGTWCGTVASAHRPEVIGGVLAAECAALLRQFFAARR